MKDWAEIQKMYEAALTQREMGIDSTKLTSKDKKVIVYTMGQNNPVIRIDIKE